MTCTRCFRKIAPRALEKSCKGEHRQQGGGEGEWEFPRGAKSVRGLCFLWVLLRCLPWHCVLIPLRVTLGLAYFGGWGSLCSLCIRGCGGSLQPWPWKPSSVPGSGGPWRRVFVLLSDLWPCESSTAWQELVSRIWDFSLKMCVSGASVSTAQLPEALWAVSQHLWGNHRTVCSKGLSFTLSSFPCFTCCGDTVLYWALFLITGTGIKKLREPRKTHRSPL